MRAVVAGAAGLIGSHLSEALIARGDEVVAIDDLSTGRRENLRAVFDNRRFTFMEVDVSTGVRVDGAVDAVCNLASPASPADFSARPLQILRAGSMGTLATLDLALDKHARHLLASTSEVYGEPLEHPQSESYCGNVTTVGPRACYDESKRFAEAAASTYARSFGVDTCIARIFNTYGPRMRHDDGRVVSNFVVQALRGEPLTLHGDGSQSRSFCYVEDQVRGLLALLDSQEPGPMNIGNSDELTVEELARIVLELTGSTSEVVHRPLPQDDPTRRRPDLSLATQKLGWAPTTPLEEGLRRTIDHFKGELAEA